MPTPLPKPKLHKNINIFSSDISWSCAGFGISAVGCNPQEAYDLWKYWYEHQHVSKFWHFPS